MSNTKNRFLCASIAALLAALLTLSAIASVTQFFLKYFIKLGAVGWVSLIVYVGAFAILVFFCAQPRTAACERKLAGWIIGLTFLLKLVLVVTWSHLPQRSDGLYLLQFIDRWAIGGDEILRQMSHEIYDWPLWASRAWPFLYPLRILFPTHFVFATQLFNCLLSTALLAAIYSLTHRLVTRPLLPLAFAAVSPVFYWSVLSYGYRCQGVLLLLAALALIRFFLCGSKPARWRTLLMSVLLGLILFLLHLQQGLDLVVIALLLFTLAYAAWQQHYARHFFRLVLLTLVLPTAIMLPLSRATDNWFAKRNEGKLYGGFIFQMAVGWNLVTWGELYWPVAELDIRTPPEQKTKVMLDYIQQQIREHPFNAIVRLPFVKVIKLFQLGAANATEITFEEMGHAGWAAIFKASRLVFTPIVLLLAAIGSRRFLNSGEPERMMWILLILDFTAAYTFFCEVSPNYSIFFQFVLLACAAEGVAILCDFFTTARQRVIQPTPLTQS